MDASRFDALTRALAAPKTRRGFLTGLGGVLLGAGAASAQDGCPPGQSPNRKGDCSCPPGTDACPDGCYDLDRDPNHCGACDQTCPGGTCRKGECRCTPDCDGKLCGEGNGCGGICSSGFCPPCQMCTGTGCAPDPAAAGDPCGDGFICCIDGTCNTECT